MCELKGKTDLDATVRPILTCLYLYLTKPHIQWVPGALSLGVKRPGLEANHSPPPSAEVEEVWRYTSTSPIRLHSVVLS
jgi:hypothetical protein